MKEGNEERQRKGKERRKKLGEGKRKERKVEEEDKKN